MSKFVNVFFDGTENTEAKSAKEKTHIRRVFEYIANTFGDGASLEVHRNIACRLSHGLPDGNIRTSIYIEGIRGPLKSIAGLGLLRRVAIAAYLISKNEQPGDVITIFGFSRGGAEALLLAHFIREIGHPILPRFKDEADAEAELKKWIHLKNSRSILTIEQLLEEFVDKSNDVNDKFLSYKEIALNWNDAFTVGRDRISLLFLIDAVFATMDCSRKTKHWACNVTSIGKRLCHIIANDEDRAIFGFARLRNIKTKERPSDAEHFVALDGSHSDIGGLYPTSTLGLDSLESMLSELKKLGMNCDSAAEFDIRRMTDITLTRESKDRSLARTMFWRACGLKDRKAEFANEIRSVPTNSKQILTAPGGPVGHLSRFFFVHRDFIAEQLTKQPDAASSLSSQIDLSAVPNNEIIEFKKGMKIEDLDNMVLCFYCDVKRWKENDIRTINNTIQKIERNTSLIVEQSCNAEANKILIQMRADIEACRSEIEEYELLTPKGRRMKSSVYMGEEQMMTSHVAKFDRFLSHNIKVLAEISLSHNVHKSLRA